jgi:nitrous oxidase accessory protein
MMPFSQRGARKSLRLLLAGAALSFALGPVAVHGESRQPEELGRALQAAIDEAEPGDRLELEAGRYAGPIIVDKKLTIAGGGRVQVTGNGEDAVIVVRADGVVLDGLTLRQPQSGEATAVLVEEADGATLSNLVIETDGYGIKLRGADRAALSGNRIDWTGSGGAQDRVGVGRKSNGIDLYDSHDAAIASNEVYDMRDGIYLENSHRANVEQNRVYRSRYGIHCMYTDGTQIVGNEGEYNVTGAMVMGVTDALVKDNSFRKQSENVNSQGLLLFDVQTSRIENNLFEGNRVGIYMEQSSDNLLTRNAVERNFMGIQFLESANNRFSDNRFIANVIEAEASDSAGNRMDGNFWDAVQGLDLQGDGLSDISYEINPFYSQLIDRTPAFQLFFQSPGMVYLSEMFTADRGKWARDASPLMNLPDGVPNPSQSEPERGSMVWLLGLALLGGSVFIMYKGAR